MNHTKLYGAVFALILLGFGAIVLRTPAPALVSPSEQSAIVDLEDGDTYTLTAAPVQKVIAGKTYTMLAYNGTIPGPTIRVQKGAKVTITVKNELGEDTTLHSHGVRMDNAFDGVPDVTQKPIKNGETFAYQLRFPDAGAFWYHPHVATSKTVEMGLYGMMLVEDGSVPANKEVPLVLDDILVYKDGVVPFPRSGVDYALMGRYGNTLLVNGETQWRMEAQAGEVVRFHVVDAANARPFDISIPGAKIKLVGSDGGAYQRQIVADHVIVSPGERATVDALFEKPGTYVLTHTTPDKTYALGVIAVGTTRVVQSYAEEFERLRTSDIGMSAARIAQLIQQAPDKKIRITMDMQMGGMAGMHMMPDGTMMGGHMAGMMSENMAEASSTDGIEWEDSMGAMNARSSDQLVKWKLIDEATSKANMDIMWSFATGALVKVHVTNDPNSMHPMQHPIHFHGQRFLVLSVNGIPNTNLVWKDTVLVPAGATFDLAVEMSNPGIWMAHCHILEHADDGMMFAFEVR